MRVGGTFKEKLVKFLYRPVKVEEGKGKEWYQKMLPEAEKVSTHRQLRKFHWKLVYRYEHNYSSIIFVMLLMIVASFKMANRGRQGSLSGFQASAVMWEFIDYMTKDPGPKRLIYFDQLLRPGYAEEATTFKPNLMARLQKAAETQLVGLDKIPTEGMHHSQKEAMVKTRYRLERIKKGTPPAPFKVKADD